MFVSHVIDQLFRAAVMRETNELGVSREVPRPFHASLHLASGVSIRAERIERLGQRTSKVWVEATVTTPAHVIFIHEDAVIAATMEPKE